ncbi:YkvA family protein [Streptomyces sp. NPDC056231]|uniref:YkvA family protein n=1 Tax=unclassified Streptomyces TaxID=2593676 RepID=UPI0033DD5D03
MIYLALPIDLIPDVLPVIGYADDAIIVAFTLRSVVRRQESTPCALTGPAPMTVCGAVPPDRPESSCGRH